MEELPPGFRFFPTEEELVSFYLQNKLEARRPDIHRVIPLIDIYDLEPWHLPKLAGELCRADTEQWFFFTPRQEREARGGRPNRTTGTGYWKATGSPSHVYSSDNRAIGVKKTMVFYKGRAPTGRKTKWKMNEYRAIKEVQMGTSAISGAVPKLRHEFSLCRVYIVSGTFRAFDRRPSAPAAMGGTSAAAAAAMGEALPNQQPHDNEAAPSAEAAMVAESTSSATADSPNSAGNDAEVLPTQGPNLGMANAPEFLWDWEQLDWL